tara:strand:- start:827 stop:1171 length:345 start_codon:yes stop_codon:yes gene_type:complete
MLTDVFNKITYHLSKGEEVEFSVGGSYLETRWIKNPLDDNETSILYMYIIEEVCTQSFFTDVGYGADGVFKFTLDSLDAIVIYEECTLFLECIVEVYDENGEIDEVVRETLNVN